MNKWIKDNLVLLSGIVLPILLVIGFVILNNVPRMLAEPPAHDFLLVAYRYDYQNPRDYYLSFEVRDGKLSGVAAPKRNDEQTNHFQAAQLYRYRALENRFEELVFDLPDGLETLQQPKPLDLAEAGMLILDKRRESSDGYQFESLGYRGRGGLLGELFGMNRSYQSDYVLRKGSNIVNLPQLSYDAYYNQNDVQFIGWINDGETSP